MRLRQIEATVLFLSEAIGPRSYTNLLELNKSADYIEEKLSSYGCNVKRQSFAYMENTYHNIIGEVKGHKDSEILVIGAHYDTVPGSPGADDNASGIAGLLELARLAVANPVSRTVCFSPFTLEEPPFFRASSPGS